MVGFTGTKSLECLGIKLFLTSRPACHFNTIAIKSPVSQPALEEIGGACAQITSRHLAKVKCGEGHLSRPGGEANPEQSHSWKAGADFHWWFWQSETSVIQWSTTPPLCPTRGPASKNVPAYPSTRLPSQEREHSFSTLSFSGFCGKAVHSASPLHFLGRARRQKCALHMVEIT